MNKAELAAALLESRPELGSKAAAEKTLGAVLDAIRDGLKKDSKVQIAGFGTFSAKKRPARTVMNPRTRMPVEVPERWAVGFRAGKPLKESL